MRLEGRIALVLELDGVLLSSHCAYLGFVRRGGVLEGTRCRAGRRDGERLTQDDRRRACE